MKRATSKIENATQPALTVGLDVSDKKCLFCVVDELGEISSTGDIKLTEAALSMQFAYMPRARVVFEVGTHSRWLLQLFENWGHEVIVANARKLAMISQNDRKSDQADAELLARLGRSDIKLLSPIEHRSPAAQKGLVTIRSRAVLVRSRTMLVNNVRSQVKAAGGRLPTCDADHFSEHAESLPADLKADLAPLLVLVGQLSIQIKMFDKKLERDADQIAPLARKLTTVPGVGLLTAVSFALVIDDPSRFSSSRDVGAYLGLVPRRSQSGEIDKAMRISKAGDIYTRQLLVQCAQSVLRKSGQDSELRQWGVKLAGEGKGKAQKRRAVIAVARKLAVLLHRMMASGESYQPFYVQKRKESAAEKKAA